MTNAPPEGAGPSDAPRRRFPTLRCGLASALLLWLAQPPVGWWPLAWVAPLGWLAIVPRSEPLDRGDWLRVYLSGVVYWLLAIHWIRLPHPLTILGWPLLCAYLGLYPLAFVWLTRVGFHLPSPSRGGGYALWLVAPIVWVGLEYVQAHLFTGFLMGALSHSQHEQLSLLPLATLLGAYGVSSLFVLPTAIATDLVNDAIKGRGQCDMPSLPTALGACALGLTLAGVNLLAPVVIESSSPETLTVALIQGNTLATWDPDPDRSRKIMDAQSRLSLEAIERAKADGKQIDLFVWPESMFRLPVNTFDGATEPPAGADSDLVLSHRNTRAWLEALAAKLGAPMLLGCDHYDWKIAPDDPDGLPTAECYNSAMLVDATGEITAIYDKTHRVPFGEYIPLASGMPALYFLTPMAGGLTPGDGPMAMELTTREGETVRLAPSICYETVVPHVLRRHVKELTDRGEAPDLLVNVTNDAWFWGSSELDMHLACGVFRAVETGTPMVIAANGGLSAAISGTGELLAVGPRTEEHALVVDVPLPTRDGPTPYVRHGDWFAGACCAACVALAAIGVATRLGVLKGERGMPKVDV